MMKGSGMFPASFVTPPTAIYIGVVHSNRLVGNNVSEACKKVGTGIELEAQVTVYLRFLLIYRRSPVYQVTANQRNLQIRHVCHTFQTYSKRSPTSTLPRSAISTSHSSLSSPNYSFTKSTIIKWRPAQAPPWVP